MILDGLPLFELTADDKVFLEKFTNCTHLSLNECGIKSLANFPALPNLKKLELASNRLISSNRKDLLGPIPLLYKQLTNLYLGNNFLSDLDSLKPLGKSTADTLERVDLSANPVTDVHGYRDFMFDILPLLQILDGLDRSGLEDYADLVYDLDEGAASKLAKPEDALNPNWMQERELEERLIKNNKNARA